MASFSYCDDDIVCIPFSYDAEEQIQEAWPIKCCFVVKEIMQTEIAYVQALEDIIKVTGSDCISCNKQLVDYACQDCFGYNRNWP